MRPDPTVSVGLPVHNGERYLADALESLRNQTFGDLEILVVDNASTDGSADLAQDAAAADPRVRVIRLDHNVGAARNFNRAFAESTGRYFKWAAHDDCYEPTWLQRCVEVLDADPSVSLAYTQTVNIDHRGSRTGTYTGGDHAASADPLERAEDVVLDPTPCYEVFGLVRRDELATTGLIGAYTSSDRPLLLELALIGRHHEVDEPLFLHRQHARRSVHAHDGGRQRKAWFDPDAGAHNHPVWRLGVEYRRAGRRQLASRSDRARLDGVLARWAWGQRRRLSKETVRAGLRPLTRIAESVRANASTMGQREAA